MTRRQALAAGTVALVSPAAAALPSPKALAFDAFPIFDPRSISALAVQLVPAQGDALVRAWFAELFSATWLVTSGEHYQEFVTLADKTLRAVAEAAHVDIPAAARSRLTDQFSRLDVWPDVKPALALLRNAGVRLCFVSNLAEPTLRANMDRAGISSAFEIALSTDRVRRFKPSPAAYGMAASALGLSKSEIGFVAFGEWDAVGATWFGYRAAWINRLAAASKSLSVPPAVETRGIEGALRLAGLS